MIATTDGVILPHELTAAVHMDQQINFFYYILIPATTTTTTTTYWLVCTPTHHREPAIVLIRFQIKTYRALNRAQSIPFASASSLTAALLIYGKNELLQLIRQCADRNPVALLSSTSPRCQGFNIMEA